MRRPLLLLLLLTCAATLSCPMGGKQIRRTYYSFGYPTENAVQRYATPRHKVQIRVRQFDVANAYDRAEIVYRSSAFELRYYAYRLWVSKPRKLLAELMSSYLRTSNIVSDVVQQIGESLPDYTLESDVIAIEELDSTRDQWFAHLAMRFALVRYEDKVVVWQYGFDEKKRVYQRDPTYVVKAMSEIFREQMQVALGQMDSYLESVLDSPMPAPGLAARKVPVRVTGPKDVAGPEGTPEEKPRVRLIR
jgi:ABC-type uncharacterized transport system auxiliary subunit